MRAFEEDADEAVKHRIAVFELLLVHRGKSDFHANFRLDVFEKQSQLALVEIIMHEEQIHRDRIVEFLVQKNPRNDRQSYFTKFMDSFNQIALFGNGRFEDQVPKFGKILKLGIEAMELFFACDKIDFSELFQLLFLEFLRFDPDWIAIENDVRVLLKNSPNNSRTKFF